MRHAILVAAFSLCWLAHAGEADLSEQIARAAREDPATFAKVAALKREVPRLDHQRRGPLAVIGPPLKALGKGALLALLEEQLNGAQAPGWTATARVAWASGVLEALGAVGDPRAAATVRQALQVETEEHVVRAAAAALGQVDPGATETLVGLARQPGPRQLPVISGLAECRQEKAAQALADLLAAHPEEPIALAAARSLGVMGSSWAWQTRALKVLPQRDAVRSIVARALVQTFVAYGGEVRQRAETALVMVESPEAAALIDAAIASAPGERAELRLLAERLSHSPLLR
jgi:HEAT repeat protein